MLSFLKIDIILVLDRLTCGNLSSIYNSVVTCRHISISTSASEPRNAKEIAVKKVSDVDVSMFGPEL